MKVKTMSLVAVFALAAAGRGALPDGTDARRAAVANATRVRGPEPPGWAPNRRAPLSRRPAECPTLRPMPAPRSVGELHPCAVGAVVAMGDSISTADNALSTSWTTLKQSPGLAWSIGGDEGAFTLPDELARQCNRTLHGPSTGEGLSLIHI